MAIQKTEALILSTRNYRQTSLIVDFYSRDFGKISGILKGVREDVTKVNSSLDAFSLNEIIFYKSIRSTLHLVSQCDLMKDFRFIRNDLERLKMGFSLVKLLQLLTVQEEKNEEIFNLAVSSFEQIERNYQPDKILVMFKIKLLELCGFKPHLDSCVSCDNRILSQARFSLKFGGLLCEQCSSKDIKARVVYRGSVATILYVEKNNFDSVINLGMNQAIKRELNRILDAFLEFHVNKKLPIMQEDDTRDHIVQKKSNKQRIALESFVE